MAIHQFTTLLSVLILVLANFEFSSCTLVRGSVSCLDCPKDYDLSDIKVSIKCSQVKKLAMASTEKDGTFKTQVPSDTPTLSFAHNCLAKIIGGPNQLYSLNKNNIRNLIKSPQFDNRYTTSSSLEFYSSCPLPKNNAKCKAQRDPFGSSETIDLPLPREWGLAPTSFYVPFFPIVGIP